MSQSVRSERVRLSPADSASKIRRCARAIEQGVTKKMLRGRGFSELEIEKARALLGKQGEE